MSDQGMSERRQLPDWNDLPDALRVALMDVARDHMAGSNVEDYADNLVLALYDRLARELPPPVFPLFDRPAEASSG